MFSVLKTVGELLHHVKVMTTTWGALGSARGGTPSIAASPCRSCRASCPSTASPTATGLPCVATCGYNLVMTSTGIRELKDNLSRYIRRTEAGERIAITAHGRVVAELVPPGAKTMGTPSRFDELVASGVIRQPLEAGDPTEGWPDIRLPAGTAAELIDADRGEA
jgi:prevent-host-death family protein